MKQIDFFDLFNRNEEKNQLITFLNNFNNNDLSKTKGLYILGPVGCGKTEFAKSIIREMDYDVVSYDASNSRTKNIIGSIMGPKLSNLNVIDMFSKKKRKIAIIMDEMDYMNVGDKGGIKEMIKYTRAKKTRKQMNEPITTSPIIYIGTNDNDKKIRELINVCEVIRIGSPSEDAIRKYINLTIPSIKNNELINKLCYYSSGNLHKLQQFINFSKNKKNCNEEIEFFINSITHKYNESMYTKSIVKELYKRYIPISEYTEIVKETDRTTLGLLWHENLSSVVNFSKNNEDLSLYNTLLKNLCISDYNDRIIFQNQIWQLSEQNSFIKIFYNNFLLHSLKKILKSPMKLFLQKF